MEKNSRKFLWKIIVAEYIINELPEPGSHTRDKVKVLLDMSNYATKRE